ncbi:MAG: redoxin domain-containing protein [Deltaproteobacteria bacterium]|nr:redoxin domain-containing protein [Deltaproteobacteria bacterium]
MATWPLRVMLGTMRFHSAGFFVRVLCLGAFLTVSFAASFSPFFSGAGGSLLHAASPPADSPARPRVGDKAPVFTLKTVDKGEPRTLENLTRVADTRGAVLVFVSARCPYVVQARQPLADLVKQYGGKVSFVGVNANQNESADDVKADAAQNFSFPVLRDEGSKVADLYAAERTPEVFVVDAKGVIRYHGGVADLGAALGDFTAGRTIAKAEVKAFGCTIKRRP